MSALCTMPEASSRLAMSSLDLLDMRFVAESVCVSVIEAMAVWISSSKRPYRRVA